MKRRLFSLSATAAVVTLTLASTSLLAQTKWDLPAGYPATNFHTVNLTDFANDVDKATGGKLKITVQWIPVQGARNQTGSARRPGTDW
jgi:TRAP-type transport system periplasmic protein